MCHGKAELSGHCECVFVSLCVCVCGCVDSEVQREAKDLVQILWAGQRCRDVSTDKDKVRWIVRASWSTVKSYKQALVYIFWFSGWYTCCTSLIKGHKEGHGHRLLYLHCWRLKRPEWMYGCQKCSIFKNLKYNYNNLPYYISNINSAFNLYLCVCFGMVRGWYGATHTPFNFPVLKIYPIQTLLTISRELN